MLKKFFSVFILLVLCFSAQAQTTTVDCAGKKVTVSNVNDSTVKVSCGAVPTPTPTPTNFPAGIYVAVNGKATGKGTPDDPKDISSGLHFTNSGAKPGDTVWLRGGKYFGGEFKSSLRGDPNNPITVRGFPGEHVTLITPAESWAILVAENPNVIYRDFEVACEETNMTKARVAGIYGYAANTKFINLIIRGTGGVGLWSTAADNVFYGCIVINTGWQPNGERGRGHSMYIQGDVGMKRIQNNIIMDSYGYGIHAYSQEGQLKNFLIEDNLIANSGTLALAGTDRTNILIGGTKNPAENVKILNNTLYFPLTENAVNAYLYYSAPNRDLDFSGNFVFGGDYGFWIDSWASVRATGNTVSGGGTLAVFKSLVGIPSSAYVWDNNKYNLITFNAVFSPFYYKGSESGNFDFSKWQSKSGFDKNSTFTASQNKPTNYISVKPNIYEVGRANITVLNFSGSKDVAVDLSSVLKSGDSFTVVSAKDFYGNPVASGVYSGSQVSIPVSGELNVFVLRKAQQ